MLGARSNKDADLAEKLLGLGWKVAKLGRVGARSNLMLPRVDALGSRSMESACGVVSGSCWRGVSIGMLWGKAPKAGMVGAGWVDLRSSISAKWTVISVMSTMW